MSYLHKFGPDDVFKNRMITHPEFEFVMYSGSAFINNERHLGQSLTTGSVSLYEYNVDRDDVAQQLIYPFVIKDGSWLRFPNVSTASYESADYGDRINGVYPLSASIYRNYVPSQANPYPDGTDEEKDAYTTGRRRLISLQNSLNYYRSISDSYRYDGNFDESVVNMIEIPSIFFDSGIEKGSVSLKFYFTGSLMDEAVDSRKNGELISTMGPTSGSIVGMVMYNEGFVLLTSSVSISNSVDDYLGVVPGGAGVAVEPNWTYFGSYLPTSSAEGFPTASMSTLTFKGTQKIPTLTMFATAQSGELNNSLNPTWLSASNGNWREGISTGSSEFVEPRQLVIKNTIQSQYCDFEDEFQKQTFISEIGIFDEDKNLIAIARMANPVMKKEVDEYTFKLKLDI